MTGICLLQMLEEKKHTNQETVKQEKNDKNHLGKQRFKYKKKLD